MLARTLFPLADASPQKRSALRLIARAAPLPDTGGGPRRHLDTAVVLATAVQALLAATVLVLSPPAQAQSIAQGPPSGLSGRIGRVGAEYALASRWALQANIDVTQLGDVAAASPLVGGRNRASAAMGVAHAF